MAEPRYAVHYAPPEDCALAQASARWLGRDAFSGELFEQPAFGAISPARLAELTASPRRYGLHGTLKPPISLRAGRTLAEFDQAVAALAARQEAFSFEVEIAQLSKFLAWRPLTEAARISAVAAACVTELDEFRAPAGETELVRRRAAGLSEQQELMLQRWGYPYVLDEFRFHLTLSESLQGEEARQMLAMLKAGGAGLAIGPLRFDSLVMLMEPAPGADFRAIARYGFDGSVRRYPGWPA
ncbi:DUF1045 domain-containing protein [Uliginosibacterium flavum]|uniref:DUF1045 domain-containing protein n=1 Tax=Uliginosibacterium flavum TaxID=1396831 RepID=A0ABV2TLS2_9RHOO